MPYSKCPICGDVSHLNVSNVKDWHETHYPGIPVGSLVPGKCFYCWQDIAVGERVVVRNHFGNETAVELGSRGTIAQVLSAPDHGTIFLVKLDSGSERYFMRGELRKPHANET